MYNLMDIMIKYVIAAKYIVVILGCWKVFRPMAKVLGGNGDKSVIS